MTTVSTRTFMWEYDVLLREQKKDEARDRHRRKVGGVTARHREATEENAEPFMALLRENAGGVSKVKLKKVLKLKQLAFMQVLDYCSERWPIWEDTHNVGLLTKETING